MALALVFRYAANHSYESLGCVSAWIAVAPALALLFFGARRRFGVR